MAQFDLKLFTRVETRGYYIIPPIGGLVTNSSLFAFNFPDNKRYQCGIEEDINNKSWNKPLAY